MYRCMQDFCRRAASLGIATMASGGAAPMFRFYFHAKPIGGQQPILVEALVDKAAGSAGITVKCADGAVAQPFADLFRSCLDGMAR